MKGEDMQKCDRTRFTARIALYGVMTALALVFGYIEHLIPFPIGIYGIKLGLANLVVVVMLYVMNWQSALIINLLRIFLSSLLFGSFTSFVYSISGGLLSFFVMIAVKKLCAARFSAVGVSICGAVAHNIGQIIAAVFLLDELRIAFYLPILIAVGTLTGALIGIIAFPATRHSVFKKFQ